VTTPKFDPARALAASLDANPVVSAETVLQKFLVHWKLFVACTLIVPVLAVAVSLLIPTTYKSSAQVLIRDQGGTNLLYNDVAPPFIALTGATSAEIIRSTPVASQMIETVGVEDADIARPAYKVLFGKVAALILPLLGREPEDTRTAADPKMKYILLADELKASVDATTLMADRSSGSLRDELLEVTLKSNSREKVAAMVNGLCEAFIAEYNLRSKNEILTAYRTLDEQAAAVQGDIAKLHAAPADSDIAANAEQAPSSESQPLSAGLARTISELELRLVTLRLTYTETAPEVVQARAELERARAVLGNQQALDAAGDLLSTIRKKQRQLLLAAKLFESNQSNLSIVERGLTPKKSKLILAIKYGAPAGGGLVGGMFIGAIAILLLNLLDPRLFVASDITPASGLPVIGVIPPAGAGTTGFAQLDDLPLASARPALLQAVGKLDLLERDHARVIAVTSAENEASTATVALQLAALLAREREGRVLLVDANFDQPALTESAAAKSESGLLDVLAGAGPAGPAVHPTKLPRLSFIGAGRLNLRDEAGSTRESWARFLEQGRKDYGVIVVQTGGLLNSREAASLVKGADQTFVVSNRQATKKDALGRAAALLAGITAPVPGIIHCDLKR
jgi:Mrp family chromosome partitioning ATPase/uncharacterized protein involved in exopolysaccharide biosynthesis